MLTDITRVAVLLLLVMVGGVWLDLRRRTRALSRRLTASAHTVRILAEEPPDSRGE